MQLHTDTADAGNIAGQDTVWQQAEAAMAGAMLCIGAKNGAAVLRRYRYHWCPTVALVGRCTSVHFTSLCLASCDKTCCVCCTCVQLDFQVSGA